MYLFLFQRSFFMIKQSSLFILASFFCFNGNIKIHGMDGNTIKSNVEALEQVVRNGAAWVDDLMQQHNLQIISENDPYKRICQLEATVKELKNGNQLLENDTINLARRLEISKKDLQNQAIDTENKAKDLANTCEEMKKGYTALLNEKEQLLGKISSLQHDKTILTTANDGLAQEVKRLQPYSLKTKVLITAGIATTGWAAKEAYDAYKKLSTHEKWTQISYARKTQLLVRHTAKNMASRPRQAFNFVKSKLPN